MKEIVTVSRPVIDRSDVVLVQEKGGQFDGRRTINYASQACRFKLITNILTAVNGAIVNGTPTPAKGSNSAGDTARWTETAQVDGAPVDARGSFRGNRGSGAYQRRDGKCGGRFTARRG
ncbi:MAG: hypothetical protein K2X43_23715 [Hyphomonadaceae bacterium]|jgi:hypothetical protein|nr:hypothetical protein [Hyphomonadaceae bacterium]